MGRDALALVLVIVEYDHISKTATGSLDYIGKSFIIHIMKEASSNLA